MLSLSHSVAVVTFSSDLIPQIHRTMALSLLDSLASSSFLNDQHSLAKSMTHLTHAVVIFPQVHSEMTQLTSPLHLRHLKGGSTASFAFDSTACFVNPGGAAVAYSCRMELLPTPLLHTP